MISRTDSIFFNYFLLSANQPDMVTKQFTPFSYLVGPKNGQTEVKFFSGQRLRIVLHTARENFLIDAPESVVPASFNLFRNHNSELKLKMWILNSLRKPWKMKINTLTHNLFPLNYHNFAFATLPFLTNKHIWWRELNYIKAKTRRLLKDFLKSNSLKICCLIRNEEKASETLFRLNEHSWWSQKKCFDFRLIIFFSWFMHEIWSFGTFK